jgi:hypothetical protein
LSVGSSGLVGPLLQGDKLILCGVIELLRLGIGLLSLPFATLLD